MDYLFFLITGLQQYVGGNNVTINKENADAFEDGKIDVMDVAVLMKKNAGYDIKFSHKCGNYMFVPGRIDDQNHGTDYEWVCGEIEHQVIDAHEFVNGMCKCGCKDIECWLF